MRSFIQIVESAQESVQWAYHGTNLSKLDSIARFGLQSNFRPKWDAEGQWEDRTKKQRRFHLIYFSLKGPGDWGSNHDPHGEDANVELRFPLAALGRAKWQEDEGRPGRDEYYAVSSREFAIPPSLIEFEHDGRWIPLSEFMQDGYWNL